MTTKLPYMAVSRDAGKTFGPALLVGPPGLKAVNFPSLDAGRPGQVAISYPGTTDAAAAKPSRPWNYYVAVTDTAALAAGWYLVGMALLGLAFGLVVALP